jgi:hypothetical protein
MGHDLLAEARAARASPFLAGVRATTAVLALLAALASSAVIGRAIRNSPIVVERAMTSRYGGRHIFWCKNIVNYSNTNEMSLIYYVWLTSEDDAD